MLRKVQKKIRRREDNFIRKNKGKQPKPPTFLIKKPNRNILCVSMLNTL